MINKKERIRYQRQLLLPDFGEEAQLKLKKATVFVAGVGGLGGPVCFYLAAAGVGRIIICDRDKVELSNLNRQILHGERTLGLAKTASAQNILTNLNNNIIVEAHHTSIDQNSIFMLAEGADILVDCLDNIETRRVLNNYSIEKNIPIMHAGIDGWNAQLSLLHPPKTPCLNCLFDEAEDSSEPKPVLGAVAGVIGTMQALETIKFLIGKTSLNNRLLFFDALTFECSKLFISKNENCSVCGNL